MHCAKMIAPSPSRCSEKRIPSLRTSSFSSLLLRSSSGSAAILAVQLIPDAEAERRKDRLASGSHRHGRRDRLHAAGDAGGLRVQGIGLTGQRFGRLGVLHRDGRSDPQVS